MKLKEILKEDHQSVLEKWWNDLNIEIVALKFKSKTTKKFYDGATISEKDLKNTYRVEIMTKAGTHEVEFYWPFAESTELFEMELGYGAGGTRLVINFNKLPKSLETLKLYDVNIESFAGIDKLPKLESLEVNDKTEIKAKNFLTILKCPKLKNIFTLYGSGKNPAFNFFDALFDAGVKDIAEVADELIDAGFDEYAKL